MTEYLFPAPKVHSVPVVGKSAEFPVHRIFCVGRNYAAHAAEMGQEVDREKPFYFMKSNEHLQATGGTTAYPPGTTDFHYEMELVLAIGAPAYKVSVADAGKAIYGYACGLDMTRRDLQLSERKKQRPWALGKDVEGSAVMAPITPATTFGALGSQRIRLSLNGAVVQDASLAEMVWNAEEIISHLSGFYHLRPGDLIYTGTPAGVGPVVPGDRIEGSIDGLSPISLSIGAAD